MFAFNLDQAQEARARHVKYWGVLPQGFEHFKQSSLYLAYGAAFELGRHSCFPLWFPMGF